MNQPVTSDLVMKEIGRSLTNNLLFSANVNRSYDSMYKLGGAKVGSIVHARLPQRYVTNKGAALNPQAAVDNVVPIAITDQANIGIEFTMASLKLEIDDYTKRYVNPAIDQLANTCDFDGLRTCTQDVFRTVGTPGQVPGSVGTLPYAANDIYLSAGVKLTEGGVPRGRKGILTAQMHATLASSNTAVFNPSDTISKFFRTGQVGGSVLNVKEWYEDENAYTHVVGPLGGVPLANIPGGLAEGSKSIAVDGFAAAAALRLRKGDVIQFAGTQDINPQSYQGTGRLLDLTVTADVHSDGAGNAVIQFQPELRSVGAFATCSAMPVDNAAMTIFGHASAHANKPTRQGLIYHPDAFALVMCDLDVPGGVWVGQRISNKALGVAIRFIKDYNIMTDMSPARVDIMYGWKAVRPELASRVCS